MTGKLAVRVLLCSEDSHAVHPHAVLHAQPSEMGCCTE